MKEMTDSADWFSLDSEAENRPAAGIGNPNMLLRSFYFLLVSASLLAMPIYILSPELGLAARESVNYACDPRLVYLRLLGPVVLFVGFFLLAGAAFYGLQRGGEFLRGSSAFVLSVPVQKALSCGVLLAGLPAILFWVLFHSTCLQADDSNDTFLRVQNFRNLEYTLFGASRIDSFIFGAAEESQAKFYSQSNDSKSPGDANQFIEVLQQLIRKSWHPQCWHDYKSVEAVYRFHVVSDSAGSRLGDIKLLKSSGCQRVDSDCLETLKALTDIPPLPAAMGSEVDVDFTFSYTK